jgi:hypothetical protein
MGGCCGSFIVKDSIQQTNELPINIGNEAASGFSF